MLIDAEQRDDALFRDTIFDVCICGAGPAGISLARALAAKKRSVALMEGGGLELTEASQNLYVAESVGASYPIDASRLRYLGGASNHWEGETRPLDERDFLALPHHSFNEWPIQRSDLDGYTRQADDILDLGPDASPIDVFEGREITLMPMVRRMSAPTMFGQKYREELVRSDLIRLCINANLVDIELYEGLGSISSVAFRSYAQPRPFKVRARFYVLCCGALENARILLNANRQLPLGLGNERDLVGRFFCEHLDIMLGRMVMASALPGVSEYLASDAVLHERQCLSYAVVLQPVRSKDSPGGQCEAFPVRVGRAVREGDSACINAEAQATVQQSANRDSRVTLAKSRDRFGLRRLSLDWTLSDLDHHTIKTAALETARALARHNLGRLRMAAYLQEDLDAVADHCVGQSHHMCTTRMADSPATGVVNHHCRVFGIENLYVGGSSVFASAGVSNPTYTIIKLALRLGDHLDAQLR
jgi:choline dehydrogenase-like flavoprotein